VKPHFHQGPDWDGGLIHPLGRVHAGLFLLVLMKGQDVLEG
jgi:hypothetical protein